MSIGGFKPPENDVKERRDARRPVSRFQILHSCTLYSSCLFLCAVVTCILMLSIWSYRIPASNAGRQCVATALKMCSFSGLGNSKTVTFVRAWIGTDDTRASRLHAIGQRCYLSQNIGPAVTGSAGPAPPPLPWVECNYLLPRQHHWGSGRWATS